MRKARAFHTRDPPAANARSVSANNGALDTDSTLQVLVISITDADAKKTQTIATVKAEFSIRTTFPVKMFLVVLVTTTG